MSFLNPKAVVVFFLSGGVQERGRGRVEEGERGSCAVRAPRDGCILPFP